MDDSTEMVTVHCYFDINTGRWVQVTRDSNGDLISQEFVDDPSEYQ